MLLSFLGLIVIGLALGNYRSPESLEKEPASRVLQTCGQIQKIVVITPFPIPRSKFRYQRGERFFFNVGAEHLVYGGLIPSVDYLAVFVRFASPLTFQKALYVLVKVLKGGSEGLVHEWLCAVVKSPSLSATGPRCLSVGPLVMPLELGLAQVQEQRQPQRNPEADTRR